MAGEESYEGIQGWNQSISKPTALWNGIMAMPAIGMLELPLIESLVWNNLRLRRQGLKKSAHEDMFMFMAVVGLRMLRGDGVIC
jgi:hypothetical protein